MTSVSRSNSAMLPKILLLSAFVLPALAGCAGAGDALGVSKRPPDEFAVVTKAPLVMPPEYRLRPPDAANPRPEQVDSQSLAVEALFPGRTDIPPLPSPGEQSLLEAAGAVTAEVDIRSRLNDDEEMVIAKGDFTMDLLRSDVKQDDMAGIERLAPSAAYN